MYYDQEFRNIPTPPERNSTRSGLTLIEVLVVTAIIALLITILLPALSDARQESKKIKCLAHLRQWGVAVNLYVADSKGCLPRRGQGVRPTTQIDRPEDWFNALPPLLKMESYATRINANRPPQSGEQSIWICPVATDPPHTHFFAYGMNMMLSTWHDAKPIRIDDLKSPQSTVFMADGPGMHCSVLPSFESYSPAPRHRGSVNLAFLDGHAHSFLGTYVGCGLGDPHHHDVQWEIPGTNWPEPGQPKNPI